MQEPTDREAAREYDRKEREATDLLLGMLSPDTLQVLITDRMGNLWQCRIVKSTKRYA